MVAVVPVPFLAPPVLVFVPPLTMLTPTSFSCPTQFAPLMISLPAMSPMPLNGLVQFILGVSYASLTLLLRLCVCTLHGNTNAYAEQCGEEQQPFR